MNKIFWSVVTVALVVVSCSTKPKEEKESQKIPVNDLPTLPVTLIDSTELIMREQQGNTILIFFLSDCEHCQRETTAIKEKLQDFKNHTLYFLSNESATTIKNFSEKYGLSNEPNVKFGIVELKMVVRNFGAIPTPSIYIYSKDRTLVKNFKGETPIEEVLKALHK